VIPARPKTKKFYRRTKETETDGPPLALFSPMKTSPLCSAISACSCGILLHPCYRCNPWSMELRNPGSMIQGS
jgi:hypothetical protein